MSVAPMLTIKGLSVHVGGKTLVRDVDLRVEAGQCLVVMGESGSGKSLLAHAIMGDLAPGLSARGEIAIAGHRIDTLTQNERRAFWGTRIALLPQEPWLSLDPLMRVESQIAETHALVAGRDWTDAKARAAKDLGRLGLSASARQLPFRLSGGMAQRVAIAATMAAEAGLLIADEPTKGLDAEACAGVAASLRAQLEQGRAVVVVTHDIGLARALGGRIAVMRNADMVESGETRDVLLAPRHDYTRMFVDADPAKWPRPVAHPGGAPVLRGESLSAARGAKTVFQDIDVTLARGEIACVQGPSGGGKTTLGGVLLGLLPPQRGVVRRADGVESWRYQKLYQDPVAAFAPYSILRTALDDVVRLHGGEWPAVEKILARLSVPLDLLDRPPSQVSGGELQRVAIARALIVDPVFLFADEPTSRLDPPIQRATMELLRELATERGLAMLLVTHDPDLATAMSARDPIRVG
jgi:peptide/nickel transport system ATP-binding protein